LKAINFFQLDKNIDLIEDFIVPAVNRWKDNFRSALLEWKEDKDKTLNLKIEDWATMAKSMFN
jgi:hypothetical protein